MEPEFIAPDGTIRKSHYGSGKQPWDEILEEGWGAVFAAGNVLKYVRRHAAKNGEDDLKKARWYFRELSKLAMTVDTVAMNARAALLNRLSKDEFALLTDHD